MLLHLNQWRFTWVKLRSPLGSDEVCLPIDSQDLEMVGLGGCVLDGLKLELCTILCNAGEMSVRSPPNYGTELLSYCYTRYQISIPLSASQKYSTLATPVIPSTCNSSCAAVRIYISSFWFGFVITH